MTHFLDKIKIKIPDFWFMFLVIYMLRDVVYPSGSIVSKCSLLFIVIVSFYCFYKTLFYKKFNSKFVFLWCLFISYISLQYAFTADFSNHIHNSIYVNYLIINVVFYALYYFSREHLIEDSIFIRYFFLLLLAFIVRFYYMENLIETSSLDSQNLIVNNSGYYFLFIMPFLFFFKTRNVLLVFGLLISYYFILSSLKRGAILVGGINVIILIFYLLKSVKNKFYILKYVFLLLVASISSFIISNNHFLFDRLTSSSSSGRDYIYSTLLNVFINSSEYLKIIFGYGHLATRNFVYNEAHNDWLELVIDYGLVALIMYFMFFVILTKMLIDKSLCRHYRYALFSILVIWICVSMFSMFIFDMGALFSVIVLAYIIGKYDGVDQNNYFLNDNNE